jgi:hypothetical protein
VIKRLLKGMISCVLLFKLAIKRNKINRNQQIKKKKEENKRQQQQQINRKIDILADLCKQ